VASLLTFFLPGDAGYTGGLPVVAFFLVWPRFRAQYRTRPLAGGWWPEAPMHLLPQGQRKAGLCFREHPP